MLCWVSVHVVFTGHLRSLPGFDRAPLHDSCSVHVPAASQLLRLLLIAAAEIAAAAGNTCHSNSAFDICIP